jgi:metallo-beta-lactamase class B
MKALRLVFMAAVILAGTFMTTLLPKAPAAAQGGRGGPPPTAVALSPEVANEDPLTETMRNDRMDFPAFKIIGNLYYVGTAFCASFLINTPAGNILINSNWEETIPFLKRNIESLGFKVEDTKILLASHAHPDHQTADSTFKEMSGATTEFMAEDVPAIKNIKSNGREHPIDKILHDGDVVSLGGMNLTAHLNPGHTLGCTTWTFPVTDAGKRYNVTIVCGGIQDNARLVYNANQPDVAEMWQATLDKWKTYPTDVFLGAHTWFFNLTGKYNRMKANPKVNPWIDPAGYKKYIETTEAYKAKLIAEQTAAGPPAPRGGRGGAGGDGGGAGRGPGN